MSLAAISQQKAVQIELGAAITGGALRRVMGLLVVVVRLAHRPELLVELKGPPLSVLLALALRANKQHSCFPSIDRLAQDTGYSRASVCNALNALEKAGLVKRIRRQRQSTLYILQPFAPQAPPSAQAAQAPAPPPKAVVSREVETAGRASEKPPEQPPPPTPEKANRDETPSEEARQMHLDEWLAVNKRLVSVGISRPVVRELIKRQQMLGHTPRYVEAWLKAYEEGLRDKRINGPGWLVSALRYNWVLPTAYQDMALTDKERRMRYISSEYAKYIEH